MASLPNWDIVKEIPANLTPQVTHFCVFGKWNNTLVFVVNNSDLYRLKEGRENCEKIDFFSGKQIRCLAGSDHVLLVATEDNGGSLYSSGKNTYGQIGNGTISKDAVIVDPPYQIFRGLKINQIIILRHRCLCLTEQGAIFEWGGTESSASTPRKYEPTVLKNRKIVQLANWERGLFILDSDGNLFACGKSMGLMPGLSVNEKCVWPEKINFTGANENTKIKQIVVSGQSSAFALSTTGFVYAWGSNSSKQLGLGLKANSVAEPTRVKFGGEFFTRIVSLFGVPDGDVVAAETSNGLFYIWGRRNVDDDCEEYECDNCDSDLDSGSDDSSFPNVSSGRITKPKLVVATSLLDAFLDNVYTFNTSGLIKVVPKTAKKQHRDYPFSSAFDDPATSDFRVIVDGKSIQVHRAILQIRSSHFRTMFSNQHWQELKDREIKIENWPYAVYRAFLYYLYSGSISTDLTIGEAFSLFELANSYLEDELKVEITDYCLRRWLCEETVLEMYAAACKSCCDFVIERCLEFIPEHLGKLVKTESFALLNPNHAKDILIRVAQMGLFDKKQ